MNLEPDQFPLFNIPSGRKQFSRSLSNKFTEQLTKLKCNVKDCNCNGGSRTFSQNNPPAIAQCGHLVCKTQLDHRKDFDKNARSVSNVKCNRCRTKLKYYMEDKLLEEFFTEIAKRGVKCYSCTGLHPRYNAVNCIPRKVGPVELPIFACVWCATANDQCYSIYKMEIIPENVYNTSTPSRGLARSVDRNKKDVGWAMNLCAICGKYEVDAGTAASLSCGHLCEYICATNAYSSSSECILCRQRNTVFDPEKINPKKLGYLKMGKLEKCEGGCNQKHPAENIIDFGKALLYIKKFFNPIPEDMKWCIWCVVEKMVYED